MFIEKGFYNELKEYYKRADELAKSNGKKIGSVARSYPIEVKEKSRVIAIEIPFKDYYEFTKRGGKLTIGDLIAIINPLSNTITLGRIVGFRREDVMSIARIPTTSLPEDYSTIITPVILHVELLTEKNFEIINDKLVLKGEITPPVSPIEPRSPVFLPNSNIIQELLGIPKEGIPIGVLYQGVKERKDVDVKINYETLYHHVLIVGTTGSGKTVFLKNLTLSLSNTKLKNEMPLVIAFDIQGDYLHTILPNDELNEKDRRFKPLDKVTVIYPVTVEYLRSLRKRVGNSIKHVKDEEIIGQMIGAKIAESYFSTTFKGLLELEDCKVIVKKVNNSSILIKEIDITASCKGEREIKIKLIPFALLFDNIREKIKDIVPIFTTFASLLLPRIIHVMSEGFDDFIRKGNRTVQVTIEKREKIKLNDILNELFKEEGGLRDYLIYKTKAHKGTIDNLCRVFNIIQDTGIIDVEIPINGKLIQVGEPNYAKLFEDPNTCTIIIDLRGIGMYSRAADQANVMVVYRVLEKVFEWKNERLKEGIETRPTFIIIDEAHNYFPETRSGREVNKDIIEGLINRITRLGRMRKIGVIFATHRPEDLNDLILQLTNTKIGLRSEESVLRNIGLEDFSEELKVAPSGVGVIKTPIIKCHTIFFRSYPPQCYHRSPT